MISAVPALGEGDIDDAIAAGNYADALGRIGSLPVDPTTDHIPRILTALDMLNRLERFEEASVLVSTYSAWLERNADTATVAHFAAEAARAAQGCGDRVACISWTVMAQSGASATRDAFVIADTALRLGACALRDGRIEEAAGAAELGRIAPDARTKAHAMYLSALVALADRDFGAARSALERAWHLADLGCTNADRVDLLGVEARLIDGRVVSRLEVDRAIARLNRITPADGVREPLAQAAIVFGAAARRLGELPTAIALFTRATPAQSAFAGGEGNLSTGTALEAVARKVDTALRIGEAIFAWDCASVFTETIKKLRPQDWDGAIVRATLLFAFATRSKLQEATALVRDLDLSHASDRQTRWLLDIVRATLGISLIDDPRKTDGARALWYRGELGHLYDVIGEGPPGLRRAPAPTVDLTARLVANTAAARTAPDASALRHLRRAGRLRAALAEAVDGLLPAAALEIATAASDLAFAESLRVDEALTIGAALSGILNHDGSVGELAQYHAQRAVLLQLGGRSQESVDAWHVVQTLTEGREDRDLSFALSVLLARRVALEGRHEEALSLLGDAAHQATLETRLRALVLSASIHLTRHAYNDAVITVERTWSVLGGAGVDTFATLAAQTVYLAAQAAHATLDFDLAARVASWADSITWSPDLARLGSRTHLTLASLRLLDTSPDFSFAARVIALDPPPTEIRLAHALTGAYAALAGERHFAAAHLDGPTDERAFGFRSNDPNLAELALDIVRALRDTGNDDSAAVILRALERDRGHLHAPTRARLVLEAGAPSLEEAKAAYVAVSLDDHVSRTIDAAACLERRTGLTPDVLSEARTLYARSLRWRGRDVTRSGNIELFETAYSALGSHDTRTVEQAIAVLRRGSRVDRARALGLRAALALRDGDPERALVDAERAWHLGNGHDPHAAAFALTVTARVLSRQLQIHMPLVENAVRDVAPLRHETAMDLARACVTIGSVDDALACARFAAECAPDALSAARAYALSGIIRELLAESHSSAEAFAVARARLPKAAPTATRERLQYASILSRDAASRAIALIDEAPPSTRDLEPRDLVELALVYARGGRDEDARAALRVAMGASYLRGDLHAFSEASYELHYLTATTSVGVINAGLLKELGHLNSLWVPAQERTAYDRAGRPGVKERVRTRFPWRFGDDEAAAARKAQGNRA